MIKLFGTRIHHNLQSLHISLQTLQKTPSRLQCLTESLGFKTFCQLTDNIIATLFLCRHMLQSASAKINERLVASAPAITLSLNVIILPHEFLVE